MKTLYSKISLMLFVITILIVSCTNDATVSPVKISSVWTNQADTMKLYGEQHEITSMNVGKWIRLNGTGFTGLRRILCNGVSASFYTTYVTDSYVTFYIPSTTPVPGDSTITVITNHGEYTLKPFVFK
jgi:hypothetical protein